MSREGCKAEFKLSNFRLEHSNPSLFVKSQWPWHPAIYLVYRFFFAVFFLAWIVLSGALKYDWYTKDSNRVKWFIYITNWAFLMLTLSVTVQLILVAYAYFKRNGRSQLDPDQEVFSKMPWYLKANWVLYNIGTNGAFTLTVLFWSVIYEGGSLHIVDVMTHSANSVYVIIDLFIAATPLRIYHVFHGVIFSATFVVFSIIYNAADGTNALDHPYIYEVLDWSNDLGKAVLYGVLVSFVLVPLLWLLAFGLYSLRLFIYRKIYAEPDYLTGDASEMQDKGETNVVYSATG